MPKNKLLPFSRRKSSGNVLDVDESSAAAPAPSSFRVLERPGKAVDEFQGQPVKRPFNSPLQNLRGRSAEELGTHFNRGSGQTTISNSSSSGHYYDSSATSGRYSSSSTIPSSFDAECDPHPEDESLFVPRRPKTAPMHRPTPNTSEQQSPRPQPTPPPPPPPQSFTTRAARALSFGSRKDAKAAATNDDQPPVPALPPMAASRGQERSYSPQRDRATTTSSYASTAKPDVGLSLGATDFGGDFATMFQSTPKLPPPNSSLPPSPGMNGFHRTDSPPIFPPRAQSRQGMGGSPNLPKRLDDPSGSPYSFEGTDAYEALLALPQDSPKTDEAPAVPSHSSGIASSFLGGPRGAYSLVDGRTESPELNGQRNSPTEQDFGTPRGLGVAYRNRQNQLDDGDRWVKRVELRDPQEPSQGYGQTQANGGAARGSSRQVNGSQAAYGSSRTTQKGSEDLDRVAPLWGGDSRGSNTPRAAGVRAAQRQDEDSMFDSSPTGPPSRAIRPVQPMARPKMGHSKTMTKEEFEQLQRSGENSTEQSDEEVVDDSDEDDDGDRARRIAKQRQKQEANMSVYRQQMKKVTGGGPSDLPSAPRPTLDPAPSSAPAAPAASPGASLHFGGIGGAPPPETAKPKPIDDDDDDDVPLGILQAHGFPTSARPPTRMAENELGHQRRSSATGSVLGGGAGQGNLPPFARRLPADPYFGSSVVNHSARESLGMSTTGGSVYGVPPSAHPGLPPSVSMPSIPTMGSMPQMPAMGHPGGLVGVIAGEERAKAARRGSPNPTTGNFGPAPLPANMPSQAGDMYGMGGRAMSMANGVAPPQVYAPSGNPMMAGMPRMPGMPGMPMMPGMPGMPGMPQMPMMGAGAGSNDQMQQFMAMQMQVMQNMLAMQQQQMGMSPQMQQPQQGQDYMGGAAAFGQNPQAPPSLAPPSIAPHGRAMTMMNLPQDWNVPATSNGQRPHSALPNMSGGAGPGPDYTPSIAPSERSNVGMPSRYRPVTSSGEPSGSRTQSMTSTTLTPTALASRKSTPDPLPRSGLSSTIRIVDKPKGTPRVAVTNPAADDEEDDEGWAEMKKRRQDRATSRFKFGRKANTTKSEEPSIGELYQGLDED